MTLNGKGALKFATFQSNALAGHALIVTHGWHMD